jgi:hypothetical protein
MASTLFDFETKRCPACGRDLELRMFNLSRSSKDGRQSYCRECQREYKRRHPEKEYKQYQNDKLTLRLWNTC